MNNYAKKKLLTVFSCSLCLFAVGALVELCAKPGGQNLSNSNVAQLCESVGFSKALSTFLSGGTHFVAFLRPWRRERLYWENLDTQNESRLLTTEKMQSLRRLAEQVPEFRATIDCVLQTYPESGEQDFFKALVSRRIEKNKTELTLRSEMLKDMLICETGFEQKRIQRSFGRTAASKSLPVSQESVLDPPGLQLLIRSDHWDSVRQDFIQNLHRAGGSIVNEQTILAKWEFLDEKLAKAKLQELGSSACVLHQGSESRRVNPCLPSNCGIASRLLPVLVKAPAGASFVKSSEPGVYSMIIPELYVVAEEYRLIDIEGKSRN